MKNIILLIITAPLLLSLGFINPSKNNRGGNYFATDTIPQKGDSVALNSCLKCHSKLVEKKIIHKPVLNECSKCHQSNGKEHPNEESEGFQLIKSVPQLCFTCHDEKNILKENIHTPLKDGDCFSCHDVHSSKNEHLVSVAPPALCFSCHSDLKEFYEKAAVKHSPVVEKRACLNCHSPHSSSEKKNLILPQPELCFTCHDKQIKVGDIMLPNMKDLITKSKYVHGAIDMGGCTACHNPHASEYNFRLKKSFPAGENYSSAEKKNYALCLQCHESPLFEDAKTTEATNFRDGDRNLHYVHVNKEKGRTCINCHNVHASNNLFLIADKVKFGEWEFSLNFKKSAKGGSCAPGCHKERSYSRVKQE